MCELRSEGNVADVKYLARLYIKVVISAEKMLS